MQTETELHWNQIEILDMVRSASTSFFGFSVFCTPLEPAKDPLMVKSVFSLEHKDSE